MNTTFKYDGCEYELRAGTDGTGYVYQNFRDERGRVVRSVQMCGLLESEGNAIRATEKNFEATIKKHAALRARRF